VGSTVTTLAVVNYYYCYYYSFSRRRKEDSLFKNKLRCWIYDGAIVPFTSKWYQEVLHSIPPGSRMLDVGIGTGAALVANANMVREKHITVVGVDYDEAYIGKCQDLIASHNLSDHISVKCCSFYDYNCFQDEEKKKNERKFDCIYFSGSFMILPDPQRALCHALGLLRQEDDNNNNNNNSNGRLYFTQTFELNRNAFIMEKIIKPALTYLTSIDFGRVTYVEEFEKVLQDAGVEVVSTTRIDDGKASRRRESRLVVAKRRSRFFSKKLEQTL
jgi:hypothetical protein